MTTGPAVQDITEADMIRAITLGHPAVTAMSERTRTYLPGRTVPGVQVGDSTVDVFVVASYGTPLPELTARLGVLLRPVLAGRALHLHIDDIDCPDDWSAQGGSATEPGVAER